MPRNSAPSIRLGDPIAIHTPDGPEVAATVSGLNIIVREAPDGGQPGQYGKATTPTHNAFAEVDGVEAYLCGLWIRERASDGATILSGKLGGARLTLTFNAASGPVATLTETADRFALQARTDLQRRNHGAADYGRGEAFYRDALGGAVASGRVVASAHAESGEAAA